jgi:hypothetical protein
MEVPLHGALTDRDSFCCFAVGEPRCNELQQLSLATVQGGEEDPTWPTKINLDGNAASHRALGMPRLEDPRWESVAVRARRYLNNVVEQDHRAIKRRCALEGASITDAPRAFAMNCKALTQVLLPQVAGLGQDGRPVCGYH